MPKQPKEQKPPTVPYRFIQPTSDVGRPMYALLDDLMEQHHQDVSDARFALAWQLTWKADVDRRCKLGECRKVSELEREIAELSAAMYDFVILLKQDWWLDPLITHLQRRALLDHELHHAAVKLDDQGEPVINERGRTVYRIRKHDLEEFSPIVERYGLWKRDIQNFAEALDRARARRPYWINSSRLQEKLAAAGAGIPLEIVMSWSDAEKREAETWILLQQDAPILATRPAHVTAALPREPSPTTNDRESVEGVQ